MNGPPITSFSIGEVAAMVGLAPHTIRAWERRFGVVQPGRTSSRQRRYSLDDVDTLKRVKDLANARGLPLRVAVAEALGGLPAPGLPAHGDAWDDLVGAASDGGMWRVFADLDPRLLLVLDGRGRVLDGNIAFARVTGLLRFELPGLRFSDLVDPYDRAKAVTIYRGRPTRRQDWELNLRTPVRGGLFRFDCHPFQDVVGAWLVACVGSEVGG